MLATSSSSAGTEGIRAECSVRTANGGVHAVADEHSCCTSSRCPPRRDRISATLRCRSFGREPRSCRGLHIRRIFPLRSGTPAGASRRVQRPAPPCLDAVPGYTLGDIRGSLAGSALAEVSYLIRPLCCRGIAVCRALQKKARLVRSGPGKTVEGLTTVRTHGKR